MSNLLKSIKFRQVRSLAPYESPNLRWQFLNLKKVNILVGKNGCGKTTVIEMIAALVDEDIRPTLEKEPPFSRACLHIDYTYVDEGHDTIEQDGGRVPRLFETRCRNRDIRYCSTREVTNLPIDRAVDALNEISHFIPELRVQEGVSDEILISPFFADGDKIAMRLNSDVSMWSSFPLESLPSGWKRAVAIIDVLRTSSDNTIVLIDEADQNLHPALQRFLGSRICLAAEERGCQVVIATHSPALVSSAMQHPLYTEQEEVSVFRISGGEVFCEKNVGHILDDVGAGPGDVFLSSGIIWVEGPSDRFYLKGWIDEYFRRNDIRMPIEGVDFTFAFYGGSVGKHYSVGTNLHERVDITKINPNFFIVGDSDFGRSIAWNELIKSAREMAGGKVRHWLLPVPTIEDFIMARELPLGFRRRKVKVARSLGGRTDIIKPRLRRSHSKGIDAICRAIQEWRGI